MEEKLKEFAKLLLAWGKQGGHGSPSGELETLRSELVKSIRTMEDDHRAMNRLRADNKEVVWSYHSCTLFKCGGAASSVPNREGLSPDPARAINGFTDEVEEDQTDRPKDFRAALERVGSEKE